MAAAVDTAPALPTITASTSTSTPSRAELPLIRANEGDYVDPTSVGWLHASTPDTPMEELRARFQRDGYVWIKGLIPRKDVLDMREHYFRDLARTGILAPGTSPRDGTFNAATENPLHHSGVGASDLPSEQEKVDLLAAAHVSDKYLSFLRHPALRKFIREFTGWAREVMVRRTILRHNVPHGLSTGIHYDKIFLRAGEADFLTAWVPIGDCSAVGGGLLYLEGSSPLGREIEEDFTRRAAEFTYEERINAFNVHMTKSGSIAQDAELFAREVEQRGSNKSTVSDGVKGKRPRWLVGNYEAGDVVFHDPYMIHGAGRNEDKNGRIRLSSDLRFYAEGAAADERWMKVPWTPNDGL
ncbi:hypothetical protein FQN55_003809 [Onygenales sp. PD_40]|nr:hypothetical protein FQN55_003809 [Onygenales sp. PD_40]